jgi:hypothetical protein
MILQIQRQMVRNLRRMVPLFLRHSRKKNGYYFQFLSAQDLLQENTAFTTLNWYLVAGAASSLALALSPSPLSKHNFPS